MVLGLVRITRWEMDSVCAAGPERQRYYVGGELPLSMVHGATPAICDLTYFVVGFYVSQIESV